MAYNYYCTTCGAELNQQSVLFDMQPLIFKNSNGSVLKFRMLIVAVKAMMATGVKKADDEYACTLTFQEIMQYIAVQTLGAHAATEGDKERLAQQKIAIASLTLSDVDDYTKDDSTSVIEDENDLGLFEEEEKPKVQKTEKVYAAGIQALESTFKGTQDEAYQRKTLKEELRILRGLFGEDGKYSFDLKIVEENDIDGRAVQTGYRAKTYSNGIQQIIPQSNARVCPCCGAKVFEHAGTATHRTIAFIGPRNSGKTSAIVALANYAENAARSIFSSDPIWDRAGIRTIENIGSIKLLTPAKNLIVDKRNYRLGYAPDKTPLAKGHCYSASFRVEMKGNPESKLLTLIDLPGELMNIDEDVAEDGGTSEVKEVNLLSDFPAALTCSAFVLCFNTNTPREIMQQTIDKVGDAAERFQTLRNQEGKTGKEGSDKAAPMIIVYNKCRDLERETAEEEDAPAVGGFDMVQLNYCLRDERIAMASANENQGIYSAVKDKLITAPVLKGAYQAYMRIAPFGYAAKQAPATKNNDALELSEEGDVSAKDTEGNRQYPKPVNIDRLMIWLLSVSGCIPTNAVFKKNRNVKSEKDMHRTKNHYFKDTQYRPDLPSGSGSNGDLDTAVARCCLFENPGFYDKELAKNFFNPSQLKVTRLKMRLQPKKNSL